MSVALAGMTCGGTFLAETNLFKNRRRVIMPQRKSTMAKIKAKDLTKEPPRPPSQRLGGFTILARTIDKCRAHLAGTIGDYHFDCPLDNVLFGFKGIKGDNFKAFVATGATDEEIVRWVHENGHRKTESEINKFAGDTIKAEWPPDKHDYRDEIIRSADPSRLGKLKGIFEVLELDDRVTYEKNKKPAASR